MKTITIAKNRIIKDIEEKVETYNFQFRKGEIQFLPKADEQGFIKGVPLMVLSGTNSLSASHILQRNLDLEILLPIETHVEDYVKGIIKKDFSEYEKEISLRDPKTCKKVFQKITSRDITQAIQEAIPKDMTRLIQDLGNEGARLNYDLEGTYLNTTDSLEIGNLDRFGYRFKIERQE